MLPRRTFLKNAGLLAASVAALRPLARASARTVSPNEKLNVAVIGFGGVGGSNISNCADENVVAMCDLDLKRCAGTIKKFPNAELFTDFRCSRSVRTSTA